MGSVTTQSPAASPPENIVFGRSDGMKKVRRQIERLASATVPVLIQGETGTGKEMIAQVIHRHSPWAAGPFVRVSCPALQELALDTELFNCTPTEQAERGSIFLDEVGELNLSLQAKLLQLLQDGLGCRMARVEGRLICSSSRQLPKQVESGNFRQDLFYRINVLTLQIPALRERREDVSELAAYFLALYGEKFNCPVKPLSAGVLRMLQEYHWPGNIRELENLIKRYVILGSEDAITGEFLKRTQSSIADIPLDGTVSLKKVARQAAREVERQVILRSLQANNWNRKRVARALSISYRALLYKIRDAGLAPGRRHGSETLEMLQTERPERVKDAA